MRLIECSSPRKSLVKGERFMRVKRNQSLTRKADRLHLLFSISYLLFVVTASRHKDTNAERWRRVFRFGSRVRHCCDELKLSLRVARWIENSVVISSFSSHFLTNFATSAIIFLGKGLLHAKECWVASLLFILRSFIILTQFMQWKQ